MPARVLVADPIAAEGVERLKAGGLEVTVRTGLDHDALLAAIADCEAVIVRSETQITRDVIAAAPRLRAIGRAGVGVDNIDVDAATERGIVVVNAPTGNTISAAELTLALLLALARNVSPAHHALQTGRWDRKSFVGVELRGKVAGVIGLGQVGSAVARRLVALEMRVIAHDPFVPDEHARRLGVELASLDDLLAQSDFITLHTTLTPGAPPLIGAAEIERMKPGVRLVNAARGGLIDEAALLAALDAGRVAGAAIDVFATEPATDSALAAHPRVVATPHLGASTQEAQERVAIDVAREVLNVLRDEPATTAVNAPFIDSASLEVVGPYLGVAHMVGTLATQISDGQWRAIAIEYAGELANHDVTPLKAATVAGLLATISEEHVNLVSVNNIVGHRGWQVTEQKTPDAAPYANLITVRLTTSAGDVTVAGTRVHDDPRIVEINGFRVDVSRGDHDDQHGHILLLHNEDRPGRVGAVGLALGEMLVNISAMDVGKRDEAGEAIMVLSVDRALTEPELARLAAIDGIERVVQALI